MTFLDFGFLDVIDILVVAYLLYQFYIMIRGTAAMNIFGIIVLMYFIWMIVKLANMTLLSTILGQVMGVGIIALIVVFQQELRKFLLLMWNRYSNFSFSLETFFSYFIKEKEKNSIGINQIISACKNMQKTFTGALIVIPLQSNLDLIIQTGEKINADTNTQLLESIFFKNSPLHDGAVIIIEDKIIAARCVLPISERIDLPKNLGLRHKSAIGITESTDAIAIIVSEERGHISFAEFGKVTINVAPEKLAEILKKKFETSPLVTTTN